MILVGQLDSPYTRRVAVSLHLLGLPFTREPLSVFADAEAMRRINPLGRVPALVLDDGEVLIDSAAILDHLDEQAGPERALLPPRGAARRHALRLIALASGVIDKALATRIERQLRPASTRYQPWLERCRTQVASGLAALEAATGDGWYLGDRPTQPDVTVAATLIYLATYVPDLLAPGYPRLTRLQVAAEALPAFAATIPTPDELAPRAL